MMATSSFWRSAVHLGGVKALGMARSWARTSFSFRSTICFMGICEREYSVQR
jgi:hypothetical protein